MILPEQRWAAAAQRWRRAEQYGFDHGWTYDHLGWRDLVDGPWFDAVPTLAAAASVTTRLRLGTLVASPNFRHPVHFAREVTALDDLSGGRLVLGIGAGGTDFDATVLGAGPLPPRARADRYGEFVELLDLLLTRPRVTWRGEYYAAVAARAEPGCVQRPRVPFLLAANGSRTLALAARYGQGWVTSGGRKDAGLAVWWRTVAELADRFTAALAAAGRAGEPVHRFLTLDAAPVYSLSSVAAFQDAVGQAARLGFTDVITHWPRESGWYAGDEATLDAVAADVLPALRARPT